MDVHPPPGHRHQLIPKRGVWCNLRPSAYADPPYKPAAPAHVYTPGLDPARGPGGANSSCINAAPLSQMGTAAGPCAGNTRPVYQLSPCVYGQASLYQLHWEDADSVPSFRNTVVGSCLSPQTARDGCSSGVNGLCCSWCGKITCW